MQRELPLTNSIQAYSKSSIKINNIEYTDSLILTVDTIIAPWLIHNIAELTVELLQPFIDLNSEVILLGHEGSAQPPGEVLAYLSKLRIGLECMSIGSACRTFNLLLSEERPVGLGIIF